MDHNAVVLFTIDRLARSPRTTVYYPTDSQLQLYYIYTTGKVLRGCPAAALMEGALNPRKLRHFASLVEGKTRK